jgi:hypothetical protein
MTVRRCAGADIRFESKLCLVSVLETIIAMRDRML